VETLAALKVGVNEEYAVGAEIELRTELVALFEPLPPPYVGTP
jgi:hypothetical protein